MYAVTATITRARSGWESTRQVPTFYLDSSVQGIVSEEHAAVIAREIIDPFDLFDVSVTAVEL